MPSSPSETDAALFELVRHGAPGAWERLVTRFERLVLAVPLRMGLARADAEEVFQNTWLLLYRHLQQVRAPASIRSWVLTTARREAGALIGRKRREREMGAGGASGDPVPEPPDSAPDPERVVAEVEEAALVREAVDTLDERCRDLLTLLYLESPPRSYEETARTLGMKLGGVGPTRIRCLAKLADRLAGHLKER